MNDPIFYLPMHGMTSHRHNSRMNTPDDACATVRIRRTLID
ncbi:MAG: hypothetical protein OSA39_11740 [Sphingobium sp.]|nr:hypothetical protein [Sphingobium sp.]